MGLKRSDYDDYATEYAALVAWRERAGPGSDDLGIVPQLLDLLGDVSDRVVLDAGCGEGYLARILAARGARVMGIDLSPRLIALARARDPGRRIAYQIADLSDPLPEFRAHFDAVASYMVLNDVEDYGASPPPKRKYSGPAVARFSRSTTRTPTSSESASPLRISRQGLLAFAKP
jgi:SAM-dependent methyltransferase